MRRSSPGEIIIIGGGLAGSEAAWQAANRGIKVLLYEMRPSAQTGAHYSDKLAELVCSNSLGSNLGDRASGILKNELRALGSLLMECADETRVPAGGALAVDRDAFARRVTSRIESHPMIKIIREEIKQVPDGVTIIASGPLTSRDLSASIQKMTGLDYLFFYDAVAPIISNDSINLDIVYPGSRYEMQTDHSTGDYLNCPMTKEEYYYFVEELVRADRITLHGFEDAISRGVSAGISQYFEGCLPIEVIAMRGRDSLAYGPMRPVGLTDRRTGRHSFAVVQLRQDNLAKTLYNMVGFQTNLKHSEQERVFRLIPGLEKAEFYRFGQMHRNTFIYSPGLLLPTLQFIKRSDIFFAGQITGVEGYMGNIATGWLAGINAAKRVLNQPLLEMSRKTMIGALCHYITHADAKDFQPMKANLGILEDLEMSIKGKRLRGMAYAEQSAKEIDRYLGEK
jgi:methylenetetrahydrofolate--tRNA-(uracil-5-)-methyltransferase